MKRFVFLGVLLGLASALLVLSACSRSREDKAQEAVLNVTLNDFEHSAFYRRHPPASRQSSPGRFVYRFVDRYSESQAIDVAVDLEGDRVSGLTVKWSGDLSNPAVWSSVKKQFMADLLEATFWDVDYGQLSSYVMKQEQAVYLPSGPTVQLGPAWIRVGSRGSDLIVRLEK